MQSVDLSELAMIQPQYGDTLSVEQLFDQAFELERDDALEQDRIKEAGLRESFDRDFYVPNEELPQYQKLLKPYIQLKEKVDYLVENGKIGKATGESIKLRNGVKID